MDERNKFESEAVALDYISDTTVVDITRLRLDFAERALKHIVDLYEDLGCINGDQVYELTQYV